MEISKIGVKEQKFIALFDGFSKLNREDRLQRLHKMGALSKKDMIFLREGAHVEMDLAENFIENTLGYFKIPMGVATHFIINGKPYVIPMAVEETSIIAAASKTAKWIRENGEITTETLGREIIGQIQLAKVKNIDRARTQILEIKQNLIDLANADVAQGMVERGGGVRDLLIRQVDRGDGSEMLVVHIHANTCEAMGANMINQVCEYLKPYIQKATGEAVTMCILSNLVDTKITRSRVVVRGVESHVIDSIVEASLFAHQDPYRACTSNKGTLNGIDPILIATGNDWRAVEAGVHAYAATRDGTYRSITKWSRCGNELHGVLEAPIVLGLVGGMTTLHPMSKLSLKMMKIQSAEELSHVCAAVGLVQNLGALKALTSIGIIEGHMKLHIKNLTLGAGASAKEAPLLQKRLEKVLSITKRISMKQALATLSELRRERIERSKGTKKTQRGKNPSTLKEKQNGIKLPEPTKDPKRQASRRQAPKGLAPKELGP